MTAKVYVFLMNDYNDLQKFDVGFIERENKEYYDILFLRKNNIYTLKKNSVCQFDISKTGDMFDKKVCDRCYKLLSTKENFSDNRIKKGGFITKRPSCKSCRKIKDGISISSSQKIEWGKSKPVDGSLFQCPICRKTTIVGVTKIVLDHNHLTGDVRGWICESCNTGIGRFDDNINIIENGISWIKKRDITK